MRTRTLALLLPLAGALAAGAVAASPAVAASHAHAKAAHVKTSHPKTSHANKGKAHVVTKFAVTGTLTAVDPAAATVTVAVKGGKTARGTSRTIKVAPTAKINLNDAASTLAALPVGAHAAVVGTVTDGAWTATKVNAEVEVEETPAPSPSPSETASPTP